MIKEFSGGMNTAHIDQQWSSENNELQSWSRSHVFSQTIRNDGCYDSMIKRDVGLMVKKTMKVSYIYVIVGLVTIRTTNLLLITCQKMCS